MANCKPVLGYETRSDAALALSEKGLKGPAIARAIGANPNSVGSLIQAGYRRRSADHRLGDEAARRGMTIAQLRLAIIDAVVRDNLISAILDTEPS